MSIRWPFFRRKKKSITKIPDNVPDHVAIIMDGNGRWAKQRGLPRVAGHKEGMDVVRDIVIAATEAGVKILTLYAFSTENWRRPKSDFVLALFTLNLSFNFKLNIYPILWPIYLLRNLFLKVIPIKFLIKFPTPF